MLLDLEQPRASEDSLSVSCLGPGQLTRPEGNAYQRHDVYIARAAGVSSVVCCVLGSAAVTVATSYYRIILGRRVTFKLPRPHRFRQPLAMLCTARNPGSGR